VRISSSTNAVSVDDRVVWMWLFGVALVLFAGCRAVPTPETPAPTAATTPEAPPSAATFSEEPPGAPSQKGTPPGSLPETIASFSAGALVVGEGFLRRDYRRAAVAIDVTIAPDPMDDEQYQHWVEMSAEYLPMSLEAPEGAGFFDCAGPEAQQPCNLHIQLRAGFHVEIMGGGTATRTDLTDLLRGLPLCVLAAAE
jgi:hypothetical protein